ncbi:hypothetical protein JCM17478_30630 [Thermopirellula anaerolimosa]
MRWIEGKGKPCDTSRGVAYLMFGKHWGGSAIGAPADARRHTSLNLSYPNLRVGKRN